MAKDIMPMEEAVTLYKPDKVTRGRVKCGEKAMEERWVDYYFKEGKEVFYHCVIFNNVILRLYGEEWSKSRMEQYYWEDLKYE